MADATAQATEAGVTDDEAARGHAVFDTFCTDVREILRADAGVEGQKQVHARLLPLLTDEAFLAAYAGPGTARGGHRLYTDDATGFAVVIYIGKEGRGESPPHDHGDDWAIYGQSRLHTDMRDFRIVAGDRHDLTAEVEETDVYRLNPGEARLYLAGEIHSINPIVDCCYVRVAGSPADHFTPVISMDGDMARIWGPAVTERPPRSST